MSKKKRRSRPQARGIGKSAESIWLTTDGLDSLGVPGYTSLINSPDVANAVSVLADVIASATIHLMKNGKNGDVRVKNELSRFMDIHPYSLGTRKSLIQWIVTYMMTVGDGNAYVLPVTRDGYLEDLLPMPGAYATAQGDGFVVHWNGHTFTHDQVLPFVLQPDMNQPWRGRGIRVQLRDVLRNLRQASATTNAFMADKWKPSVIVKVDSLADEFSGQEGRAKLVQEYLSTEKAGEPWLIPADLMDVVPVKPLSLADLAISDSVELDKRAVAATIGVPAYFLGIGDYDRNEYNNFIRRRAKVIADGIAQVFTKQLLLSPDMYWRFSARDLYAYDLKELSEVGDNQFVRGIMTGNEVRDWLDLSPRDGLDELVMLENYIPAGMIGEQKKLEQKGEA